MRLRLLGIRLNRRRSWICGWMTRSQAWHCCYLRQLGKVAEVSFACCWLMIRVEWQELTEKRSCLAAAVEIDVGRAYRIDIKRDGVVVNREREREKR